MNISGKLYDENMIAIENANVMDMATNFTVQTKADGSFILPVNDLNDTIKFSFVGYDFDTIKAADFNGMFQIYHSTTTLDEVVIHQEPKAPVVKTSSNFLGWIVGGVLVAMAIAHFSNEKPKKVTV